LALFSGFPLSLRLIEEMLLERDQLSVLISTAPWLAVSMIQYAACLDRVSESHKCAWRPFVALIEDFACATNRPTPSVVHENHGGVGMVQSAVSLPQPGCS
jgi:hypothetical protein